MPEKVAYELTPNITQMTALCQLFIKNSISENTVYCWEKVETVIKKKNEKWKMKAFKSVRESILQLANKSLGWFRGHQFEATHPLAKAKIIKVDKTAL